jgi:hypothetical protein
MKGWKYFRSAKDRDQAQYLINIFHDIADMDYLEARADEFDLTDTLEEMVIANHRFKKQMK